MQSTSELVNLITTGRPDVDRTKALEWAEYLRQLEGCHLFSVSAPEKDKAEWLQDRRAGIGGSEIAAVMGENHWNSPRQIWMGKVGMLDDKPPQQSEAARWGNLLETTVADEWALRNNRQYVHIPVIIQDDERPWLLANIDGFTLTDDRVLITGILEVKTTSAYNRDVWENGPVPFHYLCQTNWYCGITHLSMFTIICLVGGQRLYDYDLPADSELFAREVTAADDFWNNYVLTGIEPPATAVDKELMAKAEAEAGLTVDDAEEETEQALVLEDDESERLVESYVAIRSKISALNEVKDAIYAQIKVALGSSKEAITKTHSIKVSKSNRRTCDFNKLKSLSPELYEEVVSVSTSTSLSIT